jgi:energy-coupling factor transporter transmembrane protein EcfT
MRNITILVTCFIFSTMATAQVSTAPHENSDGTWTILSFVLFTTLNFYLAKKRARNEWFWALMGIPFSFLGTIALLLLGPSYKKWPTVDEYMALHPESNQGRGISCIKCGSKSIRSWGLSGSGDGKRLHMCNSCGSSLYRSGF